MRVTDELKPCPFCGEQPILIDDAYRNTGWNEGYFVAYVYCHSCGARGRTIRITEFYGKPEGTVQDAIDAWNRRIDG